MDNFIKKGAANHWKRGESVGGRLFLNPEELIFKSHALNIQRHELKIPLKDIKEIGFNNTLLIVPNGMTITLASGQIEKFVVNNRKEWKSLILKQVSGVN